jgi:hypothetical protein
MEDRAKALAGLPAPKTYQSVEMSDICRKRGGVLSQKLSPDDSDDDPNGGGGNEKTPSWKEVSSSGVTEFQQISVDVSSGGGGNCTRIPNSTSTILSSTCGNYLLGLSGLCRDDAVLRELVTKRHRLTANVRRRIIELAGCGRC